MSEGGRGDRSDRGDPGSPGSPGSPGDPGRPKRQRRPLLGLLIGIAALGALVAGVMHFGEAGRFLDLVRGADPRWLVVGLLLQALTYATDSGVWHGVLARAGIHRRFRELYALSIVSLFTNQMVPTAGVAGTLVVVRAMEGRGVPHPTAVAAVLLDLIGYYGAFAISIGISLAVLAVHHDLSPVVLGMAASIGLLGAGITGGVLWITAPGRAVPTGVLAWGPLRRAMASIGSADPVLVRTPSLLLRAWLLRTGNFACDGLTLWVCLRAVGHPTPAPAAFAAFVIGALARVLGVVPGGLGTFEGGIVGGLALFGVAIEPGLAATLFFRGLSFWLPMLPGLWLGRRFTRGASQDGQPP